MPKFAANLSMLYPELPFLDRFEAAARDGFKAVEYLFPYAFDAREIAARLAGNGLQQVLFNAPPGNWDGGERGLACLPGRDEEFRAGIREALDYAEVLDCPRIHVMAGLMPEGKSRADLFGHYVERLAFAVGEARKQNVDILIEPINTRDIPGFYLNRQDHAHDVLARAGLAGLKVQMDLYHCQIVEGDLTMKLRKYLSTGNVGHIQIADVPDRNEPGTGEINYPHVFAEIDRLGYQGWIGCEYRPRAGTLAGGTTAGLGWLRPYLGG
jgi:2-dehydrotetronate isomerase